MIKVGIIGDDEGVSSELIRILINHPDVDLIFVDSEEHCGKKIYDVYSGFYGDIELSYTDKSPLDSIDVLFCCNTEGKTRSFMRESIIPKNLKIIDLSPDFRMSSPDNQFEYGLPELNRRATCSSQFVSNPGALATCLQLALLPLAKNLLLGNDIIAHVICGTTCFKDDEKAELSVVLPFPKHELDEVKQGLLKLQNSFSSDFTIVPIKGSFPRGVMVNVLIDVNVGVEDLKELYRRYYEEDSFTFLVNKLALEHVVDSNKCFISLDSNNGKLLVTCCIDNMLKGCVGQAVHNMNLLFNLEETTGLRLRSSVFG